MNFVTAGMNAPLGSDEERFFLRKGLFPSDEDAIGKWVKAGAEGWTRAHTAATYYGVMASIRDAKVLTEPQEERPGL